MHVAPGKAKEIVKSELQSFTISYWMKYIKNAAKPTKVYITVNAIR